MRKWLERFIQRCGIHHSRCDFDFNVVIRSIALNKATGVATLHVGGAITILSDAGEEYAECLLKAESVLMAAK